MNKTIPFIVMCVLALGGGFMLWWVLREKPIEPRGNDAPPVENLDFAAADFLTTFDLNDDKQVTFEEFDAGYGKPPKVTFHKKDGGPALSAAEAFKRWDRDNNQVVNHEDLKLIENKAWAAHQADAERRRLRARDWGGRYLMLNEEQNRVYEMETGALKQKQLPYAGRYWDPRYFDRWVRVVTAANETVEGFAYSKNGRLLVLTADAKLSSHDETKVSYTDVGEKAFQLQYAAAIKKIAFDDSPANLELAKKCREWGMATESGMLFARVLVFDRDNEEALAALGYRLEGDNFVKVN